MPKIKLTARQEAACSMYAAGKHSKADCYAEYYSNNMKRKTLVRAATALFDKDNIIKRVEQLQKIHAKKNDITISSIIDELEAARKVAIETNNAASMTAASMGKAKILGFLVDKKEIFGGSEPISVITRKIIDVAT